MPELQLVGISKKFGDTWVLEDINLQTVPNEFVVFLGPSACGKTTLLRIIAGLTEPTEGKVYLDGRDITHLPPRDRNVSMIFQNYPAYPHLNVFDNLAIPLKLSKQPRSSIRTIVNEIASSLDIQNLLPRPVYNLSGGELQRVAIGKALVKDPSIYLLDEPLSDLDVQIRLSVMELLQQIYSKKDKLIIYVTHDHTEAISLADRIAVLYDRHVMQFSSPENTYHFPRNTFIAEFLGSSKINIFDCSVHKEESNLILHAPFGKMLIKKRSDEILQYGKPRILVGIRPESVYISIEDSHDFLFPARISRIQYLGSQYLLHLESEITLRALIHHTDFHNNKGQLHICFNEDDFVFFDFNTKENLLYLNKEK